jgi:molecular chaperone GrpE
MTEAEKNQDNMPEDNTSSEENYDSAADGYDTNGEIPLENLGPDPRDAKIAELEAANAQIKDQAMRALAEAENARKRAVKDREDASKFAVSGFARDLLSVADNLRRALDAMPKEADDTIKNLITGIEATEREMLGVFERNGLRKIEPLNQPFDPNQHEVMFEMPSGGQPPGTILQILEPGYTLNGRVLRPARVGVARDEGQGSASEQSRPGGQINLDA